MSELEAARESRPVAANIHATMGRNVLNGLKA